MAGLLTLLALFLVATPRVQAGPAADTLDRRTYVQLLHRVLAEVQAAETTEGSPQTAAVGRALALLPESVEVRDADGTLAAVDLAPLRTALARTPPDLNAAHKFLIALLNLLDPGSLPAVPATPTAMPTVERPVNATPVPEPPRPPAYVPAPDTALGPPIESGEAGQRLETVLRDPLFQTNSGGGVQQGLSRAIEPLVTALLKMPALQRNLLIAIVSGLLVAFMIYSGYRDAPWSIPRYRWTIAGGGLGTTALVFTLLTYLGAVIDVAGPLLMPGLGALGVLVAVAVAAFVIFGLRRAAGPAGARMAGAFAAEAGWTAGQARTAATEAATAGDYRKAVRYRYLATLLALDESGRLHFDPALTNGELMGKVAPEVREPLRPLVAVFERLWYGGFPATEHEYQAYQAMAAGAEATAAEAAP